MHIKHKEQALKECLRVVKPKGIVSIFEMNEKGVEYCQRELGFTPNLVVPTKLSENGNNFLVEVLTGKRVNAYIFRKKQSRTSLE